MSIVRVCINCKGDWDKCQGFYCQSWDGCCGDDFSKEDLLHRSFGYFESKE